MFNKSSKISKVDKYLEKRNLINLETDIDTQVQNIMNDLAGNGFLKAGMAMSLSKPSEQATVTYLSALTEQNWILIKQNDELMKQNNEIINLLKNK